MLWLWISLGIQFEMLFWPLCLLFPMPKRLSLQVLARLRLGYSSFNCQFRHLFLSKVFPDYPIPGILQARTLEWVAISFSNAWKWKVKVKSLSCVQPSATPWTAAYHASPSMGFSRQEYWSGVPLPSPILIPRFAQKQINLAAQADDDLFPVCSQFW